MTAEAEPFIPERLLIVANEHSTNAKHVTKQLAAVDLPQVVIPITYESDHIHDELAKQAQYGDVIISAGGDGTYNFLGNIVLSDQARESRLCDFPLLPVRGGYANDNAVMINGHRSPKKILQKGRLITLQPLEVTVTSEDTVSHRYALGYFGVGGTAAASRAIEDLKTSPSRLAHTPISKLVYKALATLDAVADYPHFTAYDEMYDVGKIISDYSCLRGDRIARFGRTHASLAEPKFEAVTTSARGTFDTVRTMVKMQQRRLPGNMLRRANVSFISGDGQAIPIHYDGEVETLNSGSRVQVAIADRGYQTLTTRLESPADK